MGRPVNSIPFILVTGFLGSGKTTFLKQVLRDAPAQMNIAVIQNEFAPSNIDGEELMQSVGRSFELLEINNGSVFCVCLLGTFIHSLSEFLDVHHPDLVIMEASGLSDPAGIAELFQTKELSDKIFFREAWCVVDSAHFEKIEKMNVRYRHQVQVADRVIINKTDRVDSEVTGKVADRVRELNPFCTISRTSYCDVGTNWLESNIPSTGPDLHHRIDSTESAPRPVIQSGVVKLGVRIRREQMEELLRNESNGLIRLKGFFCDPEGVGYAIHYVHGDIRFEKLPDYKGMLHFILMGTRIDLGKLNTQLKELSN